MLQTTVVVCYNMPMCLLLYGLCIQVQSEMIWKVRDQLKEQLGKTDLQLMLEDNNQKVPVGESNVRLKNLNLAMD